MNIFQRALASESTPIESFQWVLKLKAEMPDWTANKSFLFLNGQWLALFTMAIFSLIVERIVQFILKRIILSRFAKIGFNFKNETSLWRFRRALGISVITAIWISIIPLIEFSSRVTGILLRGNKIVFTIAVSWTFLHLVDIVSSYFQRIADKSDNKFDDILIPLLRKSAKVLVASLGILFVAHSLTVDVSSILAGLGIGGLAFALAAKDTLSNLFGSLTVLLDRPFEIGDDVVIDGNVEGTIESVGFRSTRVRTYYNSLITVPNSTLSTVPIDNWGKRQYRRFRTTLGVEYSTPGAKIDEFCQAIRHFLAMHPKVKKDNYQVYFNDFADSSLNIWFQCFLEVANRQEELKIREEICHEILAISERIGANFAFPTRTVHLIQN